MGRNQSKFDGAFKLWWSGWGDTQQAGHWLTGLVQQHGPKIRSDSSCSIGAKHWPRSDNYNYLQRYRYQFLTFYKLFPHCVFCKQKPMWKLKWALMWAGLNAMRALANYTLYTAHQSKLQFILLALWYRGCKHVKHEPNSTWFLMDGTQIQLQWNPRSDSNPNSDLTQCQSILLCIIISLSI